MKIEPVHPPRLHGATAPCGGRNLRTMKKPKVKIAGWYVWGNEPVGFVTIYGWDDKGNLVGLGQIEKTKLQPNVPMNCPYP
ncbi:MAG: hypothetical protein AAB316_07205 [Bacteroidota bacterium]|mgnify:CR=1 FL=1